MHRLESPSRAKHLAEVCMLLTYSDLERGVGSVLKHPSQVTLWGQMYSIRNWFLLGRGLEPVDLS